MSIRFACEHCGHSIEVGDAFEGKHGKCKHCGHPLTVPEPHVTNEAAALRLRPIEDQEPEGVHAHLLAPQAPLTIRPAGAEDPRVRLEAITEPDQPPRTAHGEKARRSGESDDYGVTDPYGTTVAHSSAGVPPPWQLLPTQFARAASRLFRMLRDWFYVVSIFFLVLVLIGYLFQFTILLHLGTVGVVATNLGMLCVGIAYLVSLPFKESLFQGFANLFIPFYAIYYWVTRWKQMKVPVKKTLGSFVPIFLAGLAVLLYKEEPVIEKELPVIEKEFEVLEKGVGVTLEPQKRNDPGGDSPASPSGPPEEASPNEE